MTNIILSILGITPILGRVLFGFFFLFFGIWNGKHWKPTLEFMLQKQIPLAKYFLLLGIVWQTITGICLIFGIFVKLTALLLIPFDIVAVFIFHAFWNFDGEIRRLNMILFIANLTASLGGLLFLINNIVPVTTLTDFI